MMMTYPTCDQIRDYLDHLAVLGASHGLVIDTDYDGAVIRPAPPDWSGYSARLASSIGLVPRRMGTRGYTESIDPSLLTAHQRLALVAGLQQVRDVLRA